MSVRQALFLSLLTAVYLCFEMAFNGRLLDVVGGNASSEQIHGIEVYGRGLSGIAVALVVLQILLVRRNRSSEGRPGALSIVIFCIAAAAITFVSIQLLVDALVSRSTPAFRRASMNILLIQQSLVGGRAQLDGLEDDPDLFTKPAGKAFLALFPVMAVSVDRLDDKISAGKLQLIARQIEKNVGGEAGYYENYAKVVRETNAQWQRYRKGRGADEFVAEQTRQQDQAWRDYLGDLGKRGWTPSTIPRHARGAVVKKVRSKIPVSQQWDPSDQAAFREAVATQMRKKFGDGSIVVGGQKVQPGLDFTRFFSHPAIQKEMRNQLKVPESIALQSSYASATDFSQRLFNPLVMDAAQKELHRYEDPEAAYADGGKNQKVGLDSARAAIVPPVALFFSLVGAIGHTAKFCYLIVSVFTLSIPALGRKLKHVWAVPVTVLVLLWGALTISNNAVTQSRLFAYMRGQILAPAGSGWYAYPLVNILHVVAVGQGFFYPANEYLRNQILQGITYGYKPNAK